MPPLPPGWKPRRYVSQDGRRYILRQALSLSHQPDTGHIDLLFTGLVMPHMRGSERADRMRSLYPRTRILFASAYTGPAIVHQGFLHKGVALLQKPFTPSALAYKVRQILDAERT